MDDRLKEHGEFDLSLLEGDMVYLEAEGPFNIEIFSRYHESLSLIVEQLNGRPWKNVSTLKGLCTFTPEVIAAIDDHIKWRVSVGCISDAVAWVDAEGQLITEAQLKHSFEQAGLTYAFFDSSKEALKWTRAIGKS